MVRKVPERAALPVSSDPALRAALLDILQQDGYAINQLLGAFETGTWTPTFTFATPGDLSVAYSTQFGAYWRVGALVFISCSMVATPTFGTASGAAKISGLPFPPAALGQAADVLTLAIGGNSPTWPSGAVSLAAHVFNSDPASIQLRIHGDGRLISAQLQASDYTSGVATAIRINGFYPADFEHP